jgi:hypothetical protein
LASDTRGVRSLNVAIPSWPLTDEGQKARGRPALNTTAQSEHSGGVPQLMLYPSRWGEG